MSLQDTADRLRKDVLDLLDQCPRSVFTGFLQELKADIDARLEAALDEDDEIRGVHGRAKR